MAKTLTQRLEQAINIRDAIADRMQGRISENHNSYSVNDRSISKMTLDELATAYDWQCKEVRKLQKEFRRCSGKSNAIRVRF